MPVVLDTTGVAAMEPVFSSAPDSGTASLAEAKKMLGEHPKMTKVEIYANPKKVDALKEALNSIGITGLTVTAVTGCGAQKGKKEFYRGAEMKMTLLPKVRVETIVCKVPVTKVIEAAKSVLHTGSTGDGKIFVYDVENVIRISTGEEGFDALQYDYDKAQQEGIEALKFDYERQAHEAS
jgi:Amt family ammonium transporter